MRHNVILAVAAAVITGVLQTPAQADTIMVQAQNATNATRAPFTLLSPVGLATGPGTAIGSTTLGNGYNVSFNDYSQTSTKPYSGIYNGDTTYTSGRNTTTVAASPYDNTKLKPVNGNYLVAEPNDAVTINLGAVTTSFDLLWGSVDSYNTLTLALCYRNYCFDQEKITGSAIAGAAGISDLGSTSAFVEIEDKGPFAGFDQVVLTSGNEAFEFVVGVPEPMTVAVLGSGLVGLGLARRRQSARR